MPKKSIIHVHHRGDRGVDGILRLIELAGHDGPIEMMLSAMCDQIASITGVEIVSVYVRENDRLVMRGNVGFPASAIGTTSLAVGEGITGLVAECMRPISAAHAATETAYKHVPGLGEERYPVFAGVPLIGGGATIGVLVLQRSDRPFATDEVTLATALGAPVTLAIERRRASALRSARLAGTSQSGGVVLGRVAAIPTATAFERVARDPDDPQFERAFGRLREDLSRAMKKLANATDPAIGAALDRLALALCDARLRDQLAAVADRPSALRVVAKEYARASHRLASRGLQSSHAELELEELCALLGDARTLRPGGVWIADRIGAYATIVAVGRGAAALVASDAITPAAIAIARAARLPCVSDVSGLFAWIRPEDLVAVDGDTGHVLVHPAPSDIERLRQAR
jgi:phosphotransferase system enzyme I (PtsP)